MNHKRNRKHFASLPRSRKGNILVLAAFLMIAVMGFTSFVVDAGYISLTKGQLQNAADAGVLAAGLELPDGLGAGAMKSQVEVETAVRTAATALVAAHRGGDQDSIHVDSQNDIRMGHVEWNAATSSWTKSWGTQPYNLVEVALHRDPSSQHGPLDLFFAPVIGHDNANVSATATVALLNGDGFRVEQGSTQTADLIPIAVDWLTWNAFINASSPGGLFTDNFAYNEATGNVSAGSDGVLEMNMYPNGNVALPPGNRGTVDLGSPNNSANDLKRQILYGLNAFDFSFFPNNEIKASWDNPLIVNADTGLSAGIKDQLTAIIGQARAIPIFSEVGGGNGNNANYTIVKFVGIRIVEVKLTGNPNQKRVMIQPAPFVGSTVTRTYQTFDSDAIMAPAFMIWSD